MADETTFRPADGRTLPCVEGQERTEFLESGSGLRLRLTRSGARTWSVTYYSPTTKCTRRLRLGDARRMTLARARAAARDALRAVADGRDPYVDRVDERERLRAERVHRREDRALAAEVRRRRRVTVVEVCRLYVKHRQAVPSGRYGRVVRPQTVALWRGIIKNHVAPAIGDRLVETIKAGDVLEALEAAVARGGATMGPRVRDFLSSTFRWAAQRADRLGVEVPALQFAALPKVGRAQQERERALTPAEIWRLWRATEAAGPQGLALRLMVLTATRVKEALNLPWSEVDLERAVWRLPAERSKSARERTIPLSRQALELLRRRRDEGAGDRVFGRSTRLEVMDRIRAAVGAIEPWQARDLRRTGATFCARTGSDPFVVSLLLGHSKSDERVPAVTRLYNRFDYLERVRAALDRLGAWIEETVGLEAEPGDVVSIATRR